MKKMFSLLLILALALGLMTACGSTEIHSYSEDAAAETTEDLFAGALTAYAPDTLVGTVNGTEIRWNEYAYWLAYLGSQMAYPDENGEIDWYGAEGSEEPLADALIAEAQRGILQYHVIDSMAADAGIEFGESGEAFVQDLISDAVTSLAGENGTEENLSEYLQDYYMDMDVLRYQGRIQYLYTQLFNEMFGADGEKVTDKDVEEYISANGLMSAKHILYSFTDEEGNALDEAAQAAQLEKAKAAVSTLRAISDTAAREAKFDEIMNAESQDPGLAYYPDGYVFGPNEMMKEFEDGTAALKDYEVSDPVETSAGYHVILRLPLTGETVVTQDNSGADVTLRNQVAMQQFSELANARMEAAEVVYEKGFEDLNLNKLFKAK